VPLGLGQRLLWFGIAAGIGGLWAFGGQISGRPLEVHAHGVLGALFAYALGSGGFDLRAWLRWRQDVEWVGQMAGVTPRQKDDLRAVISALASGDPAVTRALREGADRAS
jgi:hypothetical protein